MYPSGLMTTNGYAVMSTINLKTSSGRSPAPTGMAGRVGLPEVSGEFIGPPRTTKLLPELYVGHEGSSVAARPSTTGDARVGWADARPSPPVLDRVLRPVKLRAPGRRSDGRAAQGMGADHRGHRVAAVLEGSLRGHPRR